nr:glycerophosphodiester phosphodiesterase GDPD1, chloroplastic-like [Tanacetum cinerariifolium]
MAVKAAIHVTDVSHLDQVNDPAASFSSLYATRLPNGLDVSNGRKSLPKFMVVGHRGHGMNVLQSTDKRMKAYKENSITSFNNAANHALDYIEFDVQVTKDNIPIIFHDNFVVSAENGQVVEKRVTDLTVEEFFSYGPQRTSGQVGKSLLRQINGNIVGWDVEVDDHSCTLEEAFQKVNPCLGFNIELKFDDYIVYEEEYLIHHTYPVYFLTNGGNEIYNDVRMNSLEEAKKLALEGGLDGIVSEVKGIFRNPSVVREIKESNLSLLTYGKLNNVPEAVHVQYLMGVEGVIVDLVQEITSAVQAYSNSNKSVTEGEEGGLKVMDNTNKIELSFLLSLVSQLLYFVDNLLIIYGQRRCGELRFG